MQHKYLTRLGESLQEFIRAVEAQAGLYINVVVDPTLDAKGLSGSGELQILVDAQRISLYVPTNGYFPDGAVRHEVLHVKRFHIDGIPKLALADHEPWDRQFAETLGALDNAIEHVFIVPKELELHSERIGHWESILNKICREFAEIPDQERYLALCLHWTFVRHVLPSSAPFEALKKLALDYGLFEKADAFADDFFAAESKEQVIRLLFERFPELPRRRSALEYINSVTGIRQEPIPSVAQFR